MKQLVHPLTTFDITQNYTVGQQNNFTKFFLNLRQSHDFIPSFKIDLCITY